MLLITTLWAQLFNILLRFLIFLPGDRSDICFLPILRNLPYHLELSKVTKSCLKMHLWVHPVTPPDLVSVRFVKYSLTWSSSSEGKVKFWSFSFLSVSWTPPPPRFLVPCSISLPTGIGVAQAAHEDEDLPKWGFFQLSEEGIIYFFLIRWSVIVV